MRDIIMIDLWTTCDEKGNPIGHGCKVGNEYYELIKDKFNVIQYANKEVVLHLTNCQAKALFIPTSPFSGKIKRFVDIRNNIKKLFEIHKNGIFWFYVPELYLHVALASLAKCDEKRVVTVFEDYSGNIFKHWFFTQSRKKIDLEIITNKHLLAVEQFGGKQVYVPDYIYEKKYERFQTCDKIEQVVCLGTMNHMKLLDDTVNAFNQNGIKLLICGKFSDDQYSNRLKKMAKANIVIRDEYISEEEYYRLLAQSKYCIIPYNPDFYKNRTSGVIQECLFLNTIPVTQKRILFFSDVPGIGYDEISDLSNWNPKYISPGKYVEKYSQIRSFYYDYKEINAKMELAFGALVDGTNIGKI